MPEPTARLVELVASEAFCETRARAVERLLDSRTSAGHWTGQLSSSALSTATAVNALRLADAAAAATGRPPQFGSLIRRGCDWLAATQLPDGSWGDTTISQGNLSLMGSVGTAGKTYAGLCS